ncbi:hypothetical protein [Myxococcus sp. Y35]|uniref:hypothetical protein n=1 Tax=Pseudomyxococcus flavus TaxID=3115648 RepID=UPI003CF67AC9
MIHSTDGKAIASLSSTPWRHHASAWALVLGLFLLPLGARGDVSPDVHRYAVSIHQLIEDLEYERGLEQVARGKKVSRGPDDDVVMSLYEGVILAELSGRLSDAEAAFKAALFLNPDATLPLLVSPKVKRHFEAVRQGVRNELAARGAGPEPLKAERASGAQQVQAPRESLPTVAALGRPGASASSVPAVSGSHAPWRDRAIIPAVAGGSLVVAAGVFWGLAEKKKSDLARPAQHIHSQADARNVANGARRLQTVSVGLLVGGMAGLGAALGMHLLGSPGEPVPLQVGLDGTSAFVAGSWP